MSKQCLWHTWFNLNRKLPSRSKAILTLEHFVLQFCWQLIYGEGNFNSNVRWQCTHTNTEEVSCSPFLMCWFNRHRNTTLIEQASRTVCICFDIEHIIWSDRLGMSLGTEKNSQPKAEQNIECREDEDCRQEKKQCNWHIQHISHCLHTNYTQRMFMEYHYIYIDIPFL